MRRKFKKLQAKERANKGSPSDKSEIKPFSKAVKAMKIAIIGRKVGR
jgi:hypothetical protein